MTAESKIVPSSPVEGGRLSQAQIRSWRQQGFCLVHGLLPQALLEAAGDHAKAMYPEPGSVEAASMKDFGSRQKLVFPAESTAANQITLHHNLLYAVADLLGIDAMNLRLTQSDVWPKYGREEISTGNYDNAEQRIHCDYPNHMLVHPPPWDAPCAVEMIIYLSDYEGCGGATAVVPRQGEDDPAYPWPIVGTPGVAGLPYINDRDRAESYLQEHLPEVAGFRATNLYEREVLAGYRFGSILFYRHDVWHRGTPIHPGALRVVQNLTFRDVEADWINTLHPGWAWSMYRPDQLMEQLIASATVLQRTVLGFPAPGSRYWNAATLAAVRARFAPWNIDLAPYETALSSESEMSE